MSKGNTWFKLTYIDFEKILLKNQLSPKEFSRKINVTQSTISKITNKKAPTTLKTANIFAKALKQNTYDLFEIKED